MYFGFCPGLTPFVLCLTAGISSILELSFLSLNVLHLPDESCSQVPFLFLNCDTTWCDLHKGTWLWFRGRLEKSFFLACLFDILILNSVAFLYIYPVNMFWIEHLTVSSEVIVASRLSHTSSVPWSITVGSVRRVRGMYSYGPFLSDRCHCIKYAQRIWMKCETFTFSEFSRSVCPKRFKMSTFVTRKKPRHITAIT